MSALADQGFHTQRKLTSYDVCFDLLTSGAEFVHLVL